MLIVGPGAKAPFFFFFFFHVQKYHSSRVLLLAYQPFAFVIISVLAFNEAKINPRLRNLFGYILFFLSSLSILVVSTIFFSL